VRAAHDSEEGKTWLTRMAGPDSTPLQRLDNNEEEILSTVLTVQQGGFTTISQYCKHFDNPKIIKASRSQIYQLQFAT